MTSFVPSNGSDYILSVLFGQSELPLDNYWVGLCHDLPEPGDTGHTIHEPTAASYARVKIHNSPSSWHLTGYYEGFNAIDLVWPELKEAWGQLRAYAFLDDPDPKQGRLLLCGTLSPPLRPDIGTQVRIRAGQLAVTVTSMTPNFQPS